MGTGSLLMLATLEGTVMAAVLALAAVGLSLTFGVMRVVNVAHGEFFMLGAVLAWAVAQAAPSAPLGFVAALVIAPALVGALAWVTDTALLKRLNYNPDSTIVATIGLSYLIQQGALSFFGPDARAVEAPFTLRLQFPSFGYSGYKLFVVAAAILVLLAVWWGLTRSRAGLVMRATQVDRSTARAFGINVDRVYAGTFALGAALAALAAVLLAPISQAHYLMGHDPLLLSFIVVIIGGLGSLRGTLLAALVTGLADGILSMLYPPTLAKILATLAVAMVLVFRPQGLFGGRA